MNTLYVTQPDTYLALDGENVVIHQQNDEMARLPLHNLEGIVAFGYTGASPALMRACSSRDIDLSFLSQSGRFMARVAGEVRGNVLLRHRQHQIYDSDIESLAIAKNIVIGKIYNARWVLERALRDHEMRVDSNSLKSASVDLHQSIQNVYECTDLEQLRGIEGSAAERYFSVFDQLILQNKEFFAFTGRSRRPPLDAINSLLSFAYVLLARETASALESVGLDPYVGFLHRIKPGRTSLALDIMEEFRSVIADRFVLTLINKREVGADGFTKKDDGAIMIKDETRQVVLRAWQARKQDTLKHPFLDEQISWGLVPYAQALLFARYLRGDLDEYPPFMWK